MKGLTPTQADTMARMPRERLLETVAAHRDSHTVAHEALARLGGVLKEWRHSPAARLLPAGGGQRERGGRPTRDEPTRFQT